MPWPISVMHLMDEINKLTLKLLQIITKYVNFFAKFSHMCKNNDWIFQRHALRNGKGYYACFFIKQGVTEITI